MISEPHRKEMLSRAYVHAIASKAGVNLSTPLLDYGMDVGVIEVKECKREGNKVRLVDGYEFRLQLKATHNIKIVDDQIVYDLEAKTYNDLVETKLNIPRLLVIVHIPENEQEWISVAPEELVIKKCAYWLHLKGRSPTSNSSSVRVSIPLAQKFTPEFIHDFIGKIDRGEI